VSTEQSKKTTPVLGILTPVSGMEVETGKERNLVIFQDKPITISMKMVALHLMLFIGVSLKITKLLFSLVAPSYLKQVLIFIVYN